MSTLYSIIQDSTLMWDSRCATDFTLLGRGFHDHCVYSSIDGINKRDEIIINLYQSCGLSVKEYLSINAEMQKLYENLPLSVEEQPAHLLKIQSLLARLPEATQNIQRNMALLTNQLASRKRQEYYDKLTEGWSVYFDKSFAKEIIAAQKQLHNAARECSVLIGDVMQRYSPNIPKELYVRLVTTDLSEWKQLLDKIYAPKTSDSDRQKFFAQLQTTKDFLSSSFAKILEQADAQKEPVHESWKEAPGILDLEFNRAKFYVEPRDVNLEELSSLAERNPQLYREKSLLYQEKLISLGERGDAMVHATQWMESLPQEAPWEEAVQMAHLFMQVNPGSSDSTKFLNKFNHWVKDQPNLHADLNGYLPFRREAEQIAITKGVLYANSDQKYSVEAIQYYEMWKMIRPDDLIPKIRLAESHIFDAEWDKSQKMIAELPKEYSDILSKGRAVHMFDVYSFPVEAAGFAILRGAVPLARRIVLPGSLEDRGLDVLCGMVQCASNQVFRRLWMPYCVEELCLISQEPLSLMNKASLGISVGQVVLPFVLPRAFEYFVPNLETRTTYFQPVVEFSGPALGLVGGGVVTYGAYAAGNPLAMPVTILASSTVSLLSRAVLRYSKDLSSTSRGMLMSATTVAGIAQDIGSIYANKVAIASVASYATRHYGAQIVSRCGIQVLSSSAENFLSSLPTVGGIPALAVASAVATLAYGIIIDFPRARTSVVLEEASRRCHEKQSREAKDTLKTAEEWFWLCSDRQIIQQYAGCIPFLERVPTIERNNDHKEWVRSSLPSIDATIEVLEKSSYYSSVKDDLQYHKIVAHLNTGEIEEAKKILASMNKNSAVHGQVVLFVIGKAREIERSDSSDVDDYLTGVQSVFQIPEYLEVVSHYQKYIAHQKRHPVLSEDGLDANVVERDQIISFLLQIVKRRQVLGQLEESLLLDALLLHVHTGAFRKAEDLLIRTTSAVHKQLAVNLIMQAVKASEENDIDKALRYLDHGIVLSQFVHQPLLKAFRTYIDLQRAQPILTKESPPEEINRRVAALDAILQTAEKVEVLPFVQKKKLVLYIQTERFQEANEWVAQQSISSDVQDSALLRIIQKATDLSRQNAGPEALAYLTNACDALVGFAHRFAIELYRNLLVCEQEKFVSPEQSAQWIAAAHALMEELTPVEGLVPLLSFLEGEMAIMHAHKLEYGQAMQIMQKDTCSDVVKADVAIYILNQATLLPPQKARLYLENAHQHLDGFKYREILQLYKNCFSQNESQEVSPEEEARWVSAVDAFITAVKPIPELSNSFPYSRMRASKCRFHISKKEYLAARSILREGTLMNEFQLNILWYVINLVHELSQKGQDQEALLYLDGVYEGMEELIHWDILLKFKDYLVHKNDCMSSRSVASWVTVSENLIAALKPIPQLLEIILRIRCRQFEVFLNQNKFHDIKHVLEQDEIPHEMRVKLQEQLIGRLVQISLKSNEFEKITCLLGISKHELSRKYKAVSISLEQYSPESTPTTKVEESIRLLGVLSDTLSTLELPLPDWITKNKAKLYYAVGVRYWNGGDLGLSVEALSSAEKLLSIQSLPENQEMLANVRRLKREIIMVLIRKTQESSYVQ